MAVRVIAGTAKGRRLKGPTGTDTRPITDMIKEALFNVLGPSVDNSSFLDLFAGSGSVGIEAISRDADHVIFVDKSPDAIRVIYENLDHCGFTEGWEVHRNDVVKALDLLNKRGLRFDYIYMDPPFTNDKIFMKVLTKIDQVDILKHGGTAIIRSHRHKELPDQMPHIHKYRLNYYGESALHYYSLMD